MTIQKGIKYADKMKMKIQIEMEMKVKEEGKDEEKMKGHIKRVKIDNIQRTKHRIMI